MSLNRLPWALALAALLAPGLALADGRLSGVLFADGTAELLGGEELILEPADGGAPVTVTTDDWGAFGAALPAGTWAVRRGGITLTTVRVVEGEATEALLTVAADGEPTAAAVEAPPAVEELAETAEDAAVGTVSGRITSTEDGAPVPDVRVLVRGSRVEAVTDADGRFTLELPAGTWDLSLLRSGFSTQTVAGVEVPADGAVAPALEMTPAGKRMQAVTITAPRIEGNTANLLEERRDTSVVAEVLGAEQMKKSGDSDAAAALRRVTGLTLLDGRYIVVRGMGERYNTALMNGLALPSPEPNRRVVPLDLFQADMLDSIVVQKTYSPDMPAEFGGGVVQLRTRRFARGPRLGFSLSGGYRHRTTFTERMTYKGGKTDWLGIDGGARVMPEAVQEASDAEPLEESDMFSEGGYSADELEAFGESMNKTWAADEPVRVAPNLGLGMNVGWGHEDEVGAFGFLLAGTYSSKYTWFRDEDFDILVPGADGPTPKYEYDIEELNHGVSGGALFSVGGELLDGTQQISATTVLTRITDDTVRSYGGLNRDVDTTIRVQRLQFVERQLFIQQFQGKHVIPPVSNLTFDWVYSFSFGDRSEPDRREHRFDLQEDGETWQLSDRPDGNERMFSLTDEENHDLRFDVTLPFQQWSGLEVKVKAGFAYHRKEKETDTRRFKFMHKGPNSRGENLQTDVESIFTDANIGPDGFQFEETTLATDNNIGFQEFPAAYALVDVPIAKWVRVLGGVRLEKTTMRSETFKRFDVNGEKEIAELDTLDVLPAVTATFTLMDGMLVRAGYGRTVNRPNLREISPSLQWEVTGGRPTFGNVELDRALIDNVDLRWEWYFGRGEVLSAAGFYKHITNPIVTAIFPLADPAETWENGIEGHLVGAEFEWRKNFGFINPALQDLYVAGNVALIYSRVEAEPDSRRTSESFPLTGQSPIVVNLQVGYDNPDSGTTVTLLYNGVGKRMRVMGINGLPDEYEQDLHTLDFIASQALPGGFKLSLKAKNLLDYPSRRMVGDVLTSKRRRGFEVGLGLSWGL